MNKPLFVSIIPVLNLSLVQFTYADNRGRISEGGSFDDNAQVCMSVGLYASLTGLDNLVLQTDQVDGAAGSVYTGSDSFQLEANGQVTVIVQGDTLTQGEYTVSVDYQLDGLGKELTTAEDGGHDDVHELQARVMLGAISAQHSGSYSGEVSLVVTPAIGGLNGCGSSTAAYPYQSTWGTLAWEDLYPRPGDADYNDMVVNFRIEESYDADDQLERIEMDFVPVARGAGYNHSMWLSLDGVIDSSQNITTDTTPVFVGDAEIKVLYENLVSGSTYTRYYEADEDIKIFGNTRTATGGGFVNVYNGQSPQEPDWKTHVSVSLNGATEVSGGLKEGEFNYRPYLHVKNTNKDIDLYQINPNDGMIDANGYPFGIMVPTDWRWPTERTNINSVYPYFSDYRQWLTGESDSISEMAEHWYQYPAAGTDHKTYHLTLPESYQVED